MRKPTGTSGVEGLCLRGGWSCVFLRRWLLRLESNTTRYQVQSSVGIHITALLRIIGDQSRSMPTYLSGFRNCSPRFLLITRF